MIKKIALVFLIALSFSFSIRKQKKFTPPGTVKITDIFFADEAEVSNFSWREYEFWIGNKFGFNSKEHFAALPDTLVWQMNGASNQAYVAHYYRHPAYNDYPVVGISYEQVQAFCKWRTDRVKTAYYVKNKRDVSIDYRLPTKEEWELLSEVGTSVYAIDGKNKKGLYTFNCSRESDSIGSYKIMPDKADVTAPVSSYRKNNFGLYNILGNVAEMVQEKGVCKGGSWYHIAEDCRIGKNTPYKKSEAWLGFRCVCVVNPQP